MSVTDLLRQSPDREEFQDDKNVKKRYRYWRLRIFYSMYIGYAFYYFTRKSFTFAMPAMIEQLGFTKADLGILGSILSITYGASKFLSGVVSDKSNPRFFMAIGLIMTGVVNIFFGFSSTLLFFSLFWGLNGFFQGWGWPPCARLLTHWYAQSERGRWWGVWNTSHNVGGAIIPLLAAFAASRFGWQWAMFAPGIICIGVGFFLMNRLRDTPASLGLPPIEKYKSETAKTETDEVPEDEEKLSAKQILFDYVLKNKYIWLLALSYFFVYVIRTGINDWTQLFLFETKGLRAFAAAGVVCTFEIGGFFGSLAAGWLSDKLFRGRRGPINILFCFGALFAIAGIWFAPQNTRFVGSILMFMMGFFIFGPQMLIGVAAAELSHKNAAGTATGFIGWIAYVGAACAGYPLGKVAHEWGWSGFFIILAACAIISFCLLIPLWSIKTHPKLAGTTK